MTTTMTTFHSSSSSSARRSYSLNGIVHAFGPVVHGENPLNLRLPQRCFLPDDEADLEYGSQYDEDGHEEL